VATIRPPHQLGSGFGIFWERGPTTIDDPEFDFVFEVELEVEDGRLVVERFTAERRPGGPPVTVGALKSVPMVGLVARSADAGPLGGLVRGVRAGRGTNWEPATLEDLRRLPEAEQAAVVYRAANFYGLPPTATVAGTLGHSRDVAAKRVQAARLAGLLEPTRKGQKGG
jgi:hypothetical protein